MVVLKKKRLEIIISCLVIALFVFSIQISKNEKVKNENNSEERGSLETTASPASGKTIVIDAGHGVPDEGN